MERPERAPGTADLLALRSLLTRLQREVESYSMRHLDKVRALRALSELAGCIEQGATSTGQSLLQAQILFALADALPAARELSRHFPMLEEGSAQMVRDYANSPR